LPTRSTCQARQLGIEDVSCLRAYAEREMTPLEHVWEIRREYGYREFSGAETELRCFVSARCATSAEGPKALFDRAVAWLVEHKLLLPGVTTWPGSWRPCKRRQMGS
jgi:hypothetical protein